MFNGSQHLVSKEAADLRVGVAVTEGISLVVVVKRPGDVEEILGVAVCHLISVTTGRDGIQD